MSDTYEINAKITADDSGFQAAFDRMESGLNQWGINLDAMYNKGASFLKGFGLNVDQLASKLGTTGPILAGSIGVAVVAFTSLKKIVSETTKEFAEDETAQLKFNAAIQANSNLTAGAAGRLGTLAEKFALMTGNSNAATQSMIATLSATGRTEEQIKKMMVAAQGLAVATGTDLNTALTQLNQTFSGSTGRLGRTTPALNDLTKSELENGAAVDVLLDKYGKFSTTLQNSSDVSIKNFNNQIGELKSILGGWFESFIKPIRYGLTTIVTFLVTNKDVVIGVLNGIGAAIATIMLVIAPLPTAIALLTTGVVALIGNFAKQKESLTDLAKATETYEDKLNKLTKAQLLNEKAQVEAMLKNASGGALATYEKRLAEINALLAEINAKEAAQTDEARKAALDEYSKAIQDATRLQQAGLASLEETLRAKQEATQKYLEALAKLGLANTQSFKDAKAALIDYGNQLSKLGYVAGYVESPEEERARYESGRYGTTPAGLPMGGGENYGTEGSGFSSAEFGGFSKLQEVLNKIGDAIAGTGKGALSTAATGAGGEAGELFSAIAQYGPVIGALMYSLSQVFQTMFSILGPAIDGMLKPLLDAFSEIGVVLANILLPVISILTPIIQILAEAFTWFAEKVMIPVANFIIGIWNAIANAINAVLGWAGVNLQTIDVLTTEGVRATAFGKASSAAANTGSFSASYLGYASIPNSATIGYSSAPTGASGTYATRNGIAAADYSPGATFHNGTDTEKNVTIYNTFNSPRALNEAEIARQQRANQRMLSISGAL